MFLNSNDHMETTVTDFIVKFMKVIYDDDLLKGFSKYESEKCKKCLDMITPTAKNSSR